MAQAVVDVLEIVEVEEDHARPQVIALGNRQRLIEAVHQQDPVRQPCQRVQVGHLPDAVFGRLARADIHERGDSAVDLSGRVQQRLGVADQVRDRAIVERDRIGRALGKNKAVIMINHGNLTVGQTVDEAAWWFITMERSCQVQLLAEAAGMPHVIDDENAMLTRQQLGTPYGGWVAFQPLYQRIVREQPDLLD